MANNSVRGLNALGYVGVNAPNPANTIIENRAPTSNDYAQFNLLDEWLYYTPSAQTIYILTSKAGGVATWANFGSGTGAVTFTTDSGTATTSASNINDLGSTNISTTGSGSTVTTSLKPNITVTTVTASGLIQAGSLKVTGLGSGVVQSNSSGVISSSQGVDGELLISSSVGAPTWATITAGSGIGVTNGHNTITLTAAANVPTTFTANNATTATPSGNNINIIGTTPLATTAAGSTITMAIASTIPVNLGGTGFATATTNGIIYGNGTSPLGVTAAGTTGQVLTNSAGVPQWGAAPTGVTWIDQTTSTTMAINSGYIANSGSLVTLTLPATAAEGSIVRVAGKGSGGWAIAQASGQTIHFGSSNTTTGAGGSLASTNRYDAIELLCIIANTDYSVLSCQGNVTIV